MIFFLILCFFLVRENLSYCGFAISFATGCANQKLQNHKKQTLRTEKKTQNHEEKKIKPKKSQKQSLRAWF